MRELNAVNYYNLLRSTSIRKYLLRNLVYNERIYCSVGYQFRAYDLLNLLFLKLVAFHEIRTIIVDCCSQKVIDNVERYTLILILQKKKLLMISPSF